MRISPKLAFSWSFIIKTSEKINSISNFHEIGLPMFLQKIAKNTTNSIISWCKPKIITNAVHITDSLWIRRVIQKKQKVLVYAYSFSFENKEGRLFHRNWIGRRNYIFGTVFCSENASGGWNETRSETTFNLENMFDELPEISRKEIFVGSEIISLSMDRSESRRR